MLNIFIIGIIASTFQNIFTTTPSLNRAKGYSKKDIEKAMQSYERKNGGPHSHSPYKFSGHIHGQQERLQKIYAKRQATLQIVIASEKPSRSHTRPNKKIAQKAILLTEKRSNNPHNNTAYSTSNAIHGVQERLRKNFANRQSNQTITAQKVLASRDERSWLPGGGKGMSTKEVRRGIRTAEKRKSGVHSQTPYIGSSSMHNQHARLQKILADRQSGKTSSTKNR